MRGRDLAAVASDVERAIQEIQFPLEYRAELLGEYAVRRAAERRVLAFAGAAGVGILLLLQVVARSWSLATIVFLTLPAGVAGGVVAALLTGGGLLSFGSIIGFLALLGIAVRNAVMLISRYRHLEQHGGGAFGAALVQRATEERAAPILMNAILTALFFVPFVLFGNIAGLEIAHPMAIVVLGGLATTTLFSLVGVPAISVLCGAAAPEPDLDLVAEIPPTVVAV